MSNFIRGYKDIENSSHNKSQLLGNNEFLKSRGILFLICRIDL